MSSKWRRFEVLLPLQFNDGRKCLLNSLLKRSWRSWITLAQLVMKHRNEGHWRHGGVLYRDNLVRIVVDVPDSAKHRQWMRQFKDRWKTRLEQLELWIVSHQKQPAFPLV